MAFIVKKLGMTLLFWVCWFRKSVLQLVNCVASRDEDAKNVNRKSGARNSDQWAVLYNYMRFHLGGFPGGLVPLNFTHPPEPS